MDIKICGLKTEDALEATIAGGASHAGFIFFPKSPRYIDPEAAAPLAARAKQAGVMPVAVTVDADDAFLDAIVAAMRPGMLQLHGKETPDRVAELKARHGLPVMKALAISTADDLDRRLPYEGLIDRFLFDAKPPKGSELPGGNAVSFDWSLLTSLPADVDYLLAGGLDADNVGEAVAIANPPGLDISSGVESAPGVKDVRLIEAFFAAVKATGR
ncbi:MAG: phosphoribosylanthranilate isomerase [Brucellaceae bacterium]|nr:phosphoribosylanthranilate isomerase [Brucellaceae bacterium]